MKNLLRLCYIIIIITQINALNFLQCNNNNTLELNQQCLGKLIKTNGISYIYNNYNCDDKNDNNDKNNCTSINNDCFISNIQYDNTKYFQAHDINTQIKSVGYFDQCKNISCANQNPADTKTYKLFNNRTSFNDMTLRLYSDFNCNDLIHESYDIHYGENITNCVIVEELKVIPDNYTCILPTPSPTALPTLAPTSLPTVSPTTQSQTVAPTSLPTVSPTTQSPTVSPTPYSVPNDVGWIFGGDFDEIDGQNVVYDPKTVNYFQTSQPMSTFVLRDFGISYLSSTDTVYLFGGKSEPSGDGPYKRKIMASRNMSTESPSDWIYLDIKLPTTSKGYYTTSVTVDSKTIYIVQYPYISTNDDWSLFKDEKFVISKFQINDKGEETLVSVDVPTENAPPGRMYYNLLSHDDHLIILGGFRGVGTTNEDRLCGNNTVYRKDVGVFNIKDNTWLPTNYLPDMHKSHWKAAVASYSFNNIEYSCILSGFNDENFDSCCNDATSFQGTFECLNWSNKTWEIRPSFNMTLSRHYIGAFNDHLIVAGGNAYTNCNGGRDVFQQYAYVYKYDENIWGELELEILGRVASKLVKVPRFISNTLSPTSSPTPSPTPKTPNGVTDGDDETPNGTPQQSWPFLVLILGSLFLIVIVKYRKNITFCIKRYICCRRPRRDAQGFEMMSVDNSWW